MHKYPCKAFKCPFIYDQYHIRMSADCRQCLYSKIPQLSSNICNYMAVIIYIHTFKQYYKKK